VAALSSASDVVGGGFELGELLCHLFFAPLRDPKERLVAGVFGHEHDDLSFGLPASSSLALDRSDRRRHRLVKTDEVDLGDVEPLLGDARRDEYLERPVAKVLERLLLLRLGHPVGAFFITLTDELVDVEAGVEKLDERLRGVARLGE
jgi:hypothetical protein